MVESTPMLRVYLDVCCLNRPFDDQRQDRVRLEAEAVDNTPSRERRSRVRSMLSGAHNTVALTAAAVTRAKELQAMGFRTYDALHLACAEQATVNVFLTTDDHVLRIAVRHTEQLRVRVANPLAWLLEVI